MKSPNTEERANLWHVTVFASRRKNQKIDARSRTGYVIGFHILKFQNQPIRLQRVFIKIQLLIRQMLKVEQI